MSQQPTVEALASNLINQTLTSIALLEQLSLISSQDASLIRSKLPHASGPFPSLTRSPSSPQRGDLPSSFGSLNLGQGNYGQQPQASSQYQNPGQSTGPPPLPSRQGGGEQRARALWDYDGKEPDDLYFRAGDILIIDEEVNAQWYKGRVIPQGQTYPLDRQALFPSNYIEKLPPQQYAAPPMPPPAPQAMVPYQHSGPPVHQPQYEQKPMYNNQVMAPPPQHQMTVAPVQQAQPEGKHKFGSQLGHTVGDSLQGASTRLTYKMANAAAGGVGFGAGSALMGNLVNKMF